MHRFFRQVLGVIVGNIIAFCILLTIVLYATFYKPSRFVSSDGGIVLQINLNGPQSKDVRSITADSQLSSKLVTAI